MNFKIQDTTWFIGAASSVLSFMIGLFAAFFLSGLNIFFGNLLLFMVAVASILVGAGLLTAAVEVYAKTKNLNHPFLVPYGNAYAVAIGNHGESLEVNEVLGTLQHDSDHVEETVSSTSSVVSTKTSMMNAITHPQTEVFDFEKPKKDFSDEKINPMDEKYGPPSTEEILVKVAQVQKEIAKRKSLAPVPSYPVNLPTIHHEDKPEMTIPAKPSEEPTIPAQPLEEPLVSLETVEEANDDITPSFRKKFNLNKIILVGNKGIDPLSDDFRLLLEASLETPDPDFVLRLKGRTFGLGARGIKTVRKNTEFVSFTKADIKKMLKKFS